jgi:hypothetical protein
MHRLRKGYVAAERGVHTACVAAEMAGTQATAVYESDKTLEQKSIV